MVRGFFNITGVTFDGLLEQPQNPADRLPALGARFDQRPAPRIEHRPFLFRIQQRPPVIELRELEARRGGHHGLSSRWVGHGCAAARCFSRRAHCSQNTL
jgi:hypothetical protein